MNIIKCKTSFIMKCPCGNTINKGDIVWHDKDTNKTYCSKTCSESDWR